MVSMVISLVQFARQGSLVGSTYDRRLVFCKLVDLAVCLLVHSLG